MNENYLLHNETAKKLYFEYAKDLPIIALCSKEEPDETVYNNATEAFILNDFYKLDAMRHCGIDEKYITGNSSDYEKFKAFCSILPKFAGHPLYLLAHIELNKHFNCALEINEMNCDTIWNEVNSYIIENLLSEKKLITICNIEYFYSVSPSWMKDLYSNDQINDLSALENVLLSSIREANENGCRIALGNAFTNFVRPNYYTANEIVKRMKSNDMSIELEECELVNMQIARDLGIEYKNLGWSWLLDGNALDDAAVDYLEKNNALPKMRRILQFDIGRSDDYLEILLRGYSIKMPIGSVISTVNTADNCLCFSRNDYFRRVLCNVIGGWVENGEYTADEKILKNLIEDILYNNLKEAIN